MSATKQINDAFNKIQEKISMGTPIDKEETELILLKLLMDEENHDSNNK